MKITIFLMCYNEELLFPLTIKYYRERFPSAKFVLVDNCSTDRSCDIAYLNGIEIKQFNSGDKQCEEYMMYIRNTIWQNISDGWVIMCDMDEWLEINEEQLTIEDEKGTTIISTNGINIIGDSKTSDLSDVDIFTFDKGIWDLNYCKKILFKVPDVKINYWWGAHECFPEGNIKFSENKYILKHMNYLGTEYIIEKHRKRYERNEVMRNKGLNVHYSNESEKIRKYMNELVEKRVDKNINPTESSWMKI